MRLMFVLLISVVVLPHFAQAKDILTNVSFEVSAQNVSQTVECSVQSAISQRLKGMTLKYILFSGIEPANSEGLSQFASVVFLAIDEASGTSETFKIVLASLDRTAGWFYVQNTNGVYPFTPVAAVIASLESQTNGKPKGLFDIDRCR